MNYRLSCIFSGLCNNNREGMIYLKKKILDILSSSSEYISGEKISNNLNISRTAVWKHIKALKNDGYEIQSVTNKGYKLLSSPDIINENDISNHLTTDFIGRNMMIFDQTDSTNTQAKLHSSYPDGSVFIADIQNQGKGRCGRKWVSPKGTGVWNTILLKPDISLSDVSQITLIAGLAACKAIGLDSKIKWPNDIVIGSKKVCGILTEMAAEIDHVNYVACGIGINVNDTDFDKDISHRATSMYIESGKKYKRNEIIARLLNEFEIFYKKFLDGGLSSVIDDYKAFCVTLGKDVSVIFKHETVTGKAIDVNDSGELIVETKNGNIIVNSGEVSVRGIYGYI